MKRICFAGLMLTSVLLSARPKLVTLGKSPDPALLRSNIDLVEKSCPFDGITIELPRQLKNGKLDVSFGHEVFIPRPLDKNRMKKWVDDLKQVRFTRLKHNFTRVSVCGASGYGFFRRGMLEDRARQCPHRRTRRQGGRTERHYVRPGAPVPSAAAGKIPISGAKFLLPEQFGHLWQFSNPAKNLNIRQVFLKK